MGGQVRRRRRLEGLLHQASDAPQRQPLCRLGALKKERQCKDQGREKNKLRALPGARIVGAAAEKADDERTSVPLRQIFLGYTCTWICTLKYFKVEERYLN